MSRDNAALLGDLIDLYSRYAACLDHGELDQWPEFFTDACTYRLVPRENYDGGFKLATMALDSKAMLKDRVYGSSNTLYHAPYYQRHIIGLPRILATEAAAIQVEANYLVLRSKRDGMTDILNCGRYLDRVVREDTGLKFAEKICVFDSELIPNSIIYPI